MLNGIQDTLSSVGVQNVSNFSVGYAFCFQLKKSMYNSDSVSNMDSSHYKIWKFYAWAKFGNTKITIHWATYSVI